MLANILTNGQKHTVADEFFSDANIAALQKSIREGVFRSSNGAVVVGDQDHQALLIVMHHVISADPMYTDYVVDDMRALNGAVIRYCVPNVYNNYINYAHYRKDIETLNTPIDRPVMARTSRNEALEFKGWF